ncbi:PhzF family phenazine biosynthesis protein [Sphaerotilus sp.]|uniref:PhzF family phenazine biosynthesis protein n=1 Tax=Sphaerotilus sp. TaxID=2093942 RepID=UPI00286D6DC3|nr:PhzF family phenazine biosynthesis protein [Sphaerotilus sp.]
MNTPLDRRTVVLDVFTAEPLKGNPLAVVIDAEGLSDAQMAAYARWTNLSETTFLLPPTDPAADYRVRIFTPGGELPFAGHPTLGSCQAWLDAGGVPREAGVVVQECGVGLVQVRQIDGAPSRLAFSAPPLRRSGPAEPVVMAQVMRALRICADAVLGVEWIDNGPGWLGVRLRDAAAVRALVPDFVAMRGLNVGVIGAWPAGGAVDVEVRAFVPDLGVPEDPVTGSLNAGLAQWLIGSGVLPARYVAGQGHALGRDGRVHVEHIAAGEWAGVWIAGDVTRCIAGTLRL